MSEFETINESELQSIEGGVTALGAMAKAIATGLVGMAVVVIDAGLALNQAVNGK